ncbi:DNA repair and recombination protein RadB [Candidatus Woesearchaeota archaeon]|nr:DNA repair and recombination protein RadB [Candidatus Woesearchaeota archaeon]
MRELSNKIPTGSKVLDAMLDGGYEKDVITTIYGPAGSGKTILCLLCAINVARDGKKVVYVDCEGGFSLERLRQVASSIYQDYRKLLDNIIFLKPTSFAEQKKAFEKLKGIVNDKIGLIIVDTIAMLYRLELGKSEDAQETNRELGRQISYLTEIARKKNIPILITNQVYADFDDKDKVNIVGGDILKYGSKCLIELQITPNNNRRLILRKHRSIQPEKELIFKIVEGGIIGTKESRGFKLF